MEKDGRAGDLFAFVFLGSFDLIIDTFPFIFILFNPMIRDRFHGQSLGTHGGFGRYGCLLR